ncbi:STAS domain-containing protein [Saccharopolyspora griseoalba]|uniref:STAS domain-containing protein n=1 Tax=Saccharopolyspora griseoalba TaxID=1431848 RepID=A0ABW2LM96_9PSEU
MHWNAIFPDLIAPSSALAVDGDLTGRAVEELAQRLWPQLLAAPPETVVDLAAAGALDATGADLLAAAHAYAAHRGSALRVVNAAPGVQRTLLAAGVRPELRKLTSAVPA